MDKMETTQSDVANSILEESKTGINVLLPDGLDWHPNQIIIGVKGDCMNSDLSPMRIRDNDGIIIRRVPITMQELFLALDKVVCFAMNGEFAIKQLVRYDGIRGIITFQQYNPIRTASTTIDNIQALFIVDGVLPEEYLRPYRKAGGCYRQ
ncbi:hypothetical protein LJC72_03565 [Bacteroides sp. OttesenSCG-928-D19]|nr:hypothetical protein [Bacteroides sp. OttesenSCG-928-D19]